MRAFTLFLDWELNCQFAGPIWALEKGLYREAGLDMQLLPPSAQPHENLIDLVLKSDCAAGSIEENLIVRAALAGKPVRAVAAMLMESPLVLITARGGPIKTFLDLPGRRIAMHADGAHLLKALLKLRGIDPKSVDLAVGDWSLEALVDGRFDAVQGYAITEAQDLAKRGFKAELIPLNDPNLNPHSQVIFASLESIAHHKSHLQAFLRATFEGWRQALAHLGDAAECVAANSVEHANTTENREILGSIGRYVRGQEKSEPLGALDPARWRRNLTSYADCGITAPAADIDLVIEAQLFPHNWEH